jgi:predicted membrane protein
VELPAILSFHQINKMRNRDLHRPHDRFWFGLFLIAGGCLFLAYRMGAMLPGWLFTFPTALIAIGLFIGVRHRFRNPFWLVPTLFGGFLLLDKVLPELNMENYKGPLVVILIGLYFLIKPRRSRFSREKWQSIRAEIHDEMHKKEKDEFVETDDSEYVDAVSVFGGVKKTILSKNFRGADITCFMGGTELDFSNADIQGTVIIEATVIFGGAKIIVPAHWDVKSEVVAVFGGIEDKRKFTTVVDHTKVLLLKGVASFGGIEIKSY